MSKEKALIKKAVAAIAPNIEERPVIYKDKKKRKVDAYQTLKANICNRPEFPLAFVGGLTAVYAAVVIALIIADKLDDALDWFSADPNENPLFQSKGQILGGFVPLFGNLVLADQFLKKFKLPDFNPFD